MKIVIAAVCLAGVVSVPVFADCPKPDAPSSIPDGNTASMQDMLAGQKAVSGFNEATTSYLDCLKKEHDAAIAAEGTDISSKKRDQIDKDESTKHNAAVDQLNSVADRFNTQVRVFKAKNAPKTKDKGGDNKPS